MHLTAINQAWIRSLSKQMGTHEDQILNQLVDYFRDAQLNASTFKDTLQKPNVLYQNTALLADQMDHLRGNCDELIRTIELYVRCQHLAATPLFDADSDNA